MKKLLVFFILFAGISMAQYHVNGWGVGFGLNNVRFMGDVVGEDLNFGAHVYVQRDMTEYSGFRLRADFNQFTGTSTKVEVSQLNLSLGYIFRFFNSNTINPYLGAGFSTMYLAKKNTTLKTEKNSFGEISADLFFGATFDFLGENWLLKSEMSQHTASTDQFDFVSAPDGGGLFGGSLDSYIQFEVGAIYFWDRTPHVAKADLLPSGLTSDKCFEPELASLAEKLDKAMAEIERLKNRPKETTPTQVIETPVKEVVKEVVKTTEAKFLSLRTVYFVLNSANLIQGSQEILDENVKVLNDNPSIKVSVEGHTDNTGTMERNKSLSESRANFVKDYLVKKGVAASRISTASFGPEKPATENNTDAGKQLNRRVEFRIK